MKTITAIAAVLAAATVLSGCDNVRKSLTQSKAAPDEFAVYTRAPLVLPPDYGLRPPSDGKGAQRTGELNTQDEARRVLLGAPGAEAQPVVAATPGTSALLSRAGAQIIEPNIRDVVDRETSAYAKEDQTFMESLMFSDEGRPGSVVDPVAESKRLQENQALGQPINEGSTPMIESKPKAPLEGMFDGWFN